MPMALSEENPANFTENNKIIKLHKCKQKASKILRNAVRQINRLDIFHKTAAIAKLTFHSPS